MRIISIIAILSSLVVHPEVLGQEESEKKPLFLYLEYYQTNDQLPRLKISTKTKVGRKFEIAEKVVVNVFMDEESSEGFLGQVETNIWGESWLNIPARFGSKLQQSQTYNFIATVIQDSIYEDASQELEIYKSKIVLELNEEDNIRTIQATLLAFEDSIWMPVPEVEVRFIAKRTLKDIPVTEEEYYETNEEGSVSSELFATIPGDNDGTLLLGAKIVDHDSYGNIETTQPVTWGTPRVADNSFSHRTLWSTRDKTPWWLLVFPNLIITAVWGIIYYIIYQLIKIRNLGKLKESD